MTQETDRLLVFDSQPWVIGIILLGCLAVPLWGGLHAIFTLGQTAFGLGVIVVGGLFLLPFFWGFVRRVQLRLDRQAGDMRLRTRTIFGYTETVRPLDQLHRAEVETRSQVGERPDLHRMVLKMRDGEALPFPGGYASGEGAEAIAARVNRWLGVVADDA